MSRFLKTKQAGVVVGLAGGLSKFVSVAGTEIPISDVAPGIVSAVEEGHPAYASVYEITGSESSESSSPKTEKVAKKPAAKKQAAKKAAAAKASGVNADALTGGAGDGPYDPGAHKVDDVLAYLESATPEEVVRVQEAEKLVTKQFRPSKRVLEFGVEPEADPPAPDAGAGDDNGGGDATSS